MIQTSKQKYRVRVAIAATLLICISTCLRSSVPAQIRPVYDQGALGLGQLLKRLNTTASVLMIGAHPDDEDTALLAYLARGESARTAYLSLTRGDGGQNLIGPELGEALGVIRTEELLQARKLDGAEQFFTRAYDYGFSKTLAEAKEKWDEKVILCDVVRVIRSYQPLVVIAQFTGTPVDGHGQHQYAGYISPLAVKAAADPAQCKEDGAIWAVKKFYVRHRGSGEPTLRINTGKYDPLLGRSYFEIAMHARSQHRSQEQGVLELKGDQFSSLRIASGPRPLPEKESGIFDGVDISTAAIGPRTAESLSKALSQFNSLDPIKSLAALFEADTENGSALANLIAGATLADRASDSEAQSRIRETTTIVRAKGEQLRSAILSAAGVRLDVLSDRETAVPGDALPVSVRLFAPAEREAKLVSVTFNVPSAKAEEPAAAGQSTFRHEVPTAASYFSLTLPTEMRISQPFWLIQERVGSQYLIPTGSLPSWPLGPRAIFADITLEIWGKPIRVRRSLEFRFADDIRGEIRRDVNIVPKLSVELDQELLTVSTRGDRSDRHVAVSITNNGSAPIAGKIKLEIPKGWTVAPSEADFSLSRKGEKTSIKFAITTPPATAAGSYTIKTSATANGETFSQTMQSIAYDHIQTHYIYRPAEADVRLIDLNVAPVRVGYIRGSGDRVADAIKQLGLTVEEIDERTLTGGDLSKFDTIVVGIRAYQVRQDIVSHNRRLLDFVKNGGTLIVQYQLPQTYSQQNLAPFPAQMGPRVTDENAPVKILQPNHPIFSFPNKIASADFEGWVQERNLYNFSTMDPKYVGLLESHDAGEPENKGGLVVADIGKGKYIYCSYSLFRQLPAGVPGAYRLLANMLSSGKTTSSRRGK